MTQNNSKIESVAQAIDQMAKVLRHYADELERDAAKLRTRGDFQYASKALQTVQNCFGNVRMSVVVSRLLWD
jgi:hypothetical protein